jgi:hypothetical protein
MRAGERRARSCYSRQVDRTVEVLRGRLIMPASARLPGAAAACVADICHMKRCRCRSGLAGAASSGLTSAASGSSSPFSSGSGLAG